MGERERANAPATRAVRSCARSISSEKVRVDVDLCARVDVVYKGAQREAREDR